MRTYLLAIGMAGLTVLPMQAGAWGGFRGGGGFHEGAGGFTSWHSAGWGGGGWGGAYHADAGGVTHVGYGGVTHVGYDNVDHAGYNGVYRGGTYYHPTYVGGGGCWGCVGNAGAAAAAGVVGLAAGAAIGSAATAWSQPVAYAGPAIGSQVLALPGSCNSVLANGTRYYSCGNVFYQPHFGSNGVYYTVVPTP